MYREHINIVSSDVYDSKTRQLPQPCVLANYSRSASSQYMTTQAVINCVMLVRTAYVFTNNIPCLFTIWMFQHQLMYILKTDRRLLTLHYAQLHRIIIRYFVAYATRRSNSKDCNIRGNKDLTYYLCNKWTNSIVYSFSRSLHIKTQANFESYLLDMMNN